MSKLTDAELAAMPPKSVRYEDEVKLYQENDFLTAYALHTHKRIAETGYKAAIGGGENWEEHGDLQRDFLIGRGLLPRHCLLDIGCGTGRLARKITRYLVPWRYIGYDISVKAIRAAEHLSVSEGWEVFFPKFHLGDICPDGVPVDFAWAFSVFIHLPLENVRDIMDRVAKRLRRNGQFLFSYVPEDRSWRSGLKQFRHTINDYKSATGGAGLTFEDVPDWVMNTIGSHPKWAGSQRIACARRIS